MTPDPEETYPYVVRKDGRNYWQFEDRVLPVVSGGDGVSDYTEAKRKLNALELKKTDMLAEVRSLNAKEDISDGEVERCDRLITGVERLNDRIGAAREECRAAQAGFVGSIHTDRGDGGLESVMNPRGESRALPAIVDRARRKLDSSEARSLSPESKAHVDHLLRTDSESCNGPVIAERLLLTENDAYRSAFVNGVAEGSTALFTPAEAAAVNEFRAFQRRTGETRAASEGTSSAGGYGIPVNLAA